MRARTDSLPKARDRDCRRGRSRAGRRHDVRDVARRHRGGHAQRPAVAETLAQAEAALADSVQRAREIEVMRETFAYAGGTRDPFASLINKDKNGPEIADLDLVGVYLDLRTPTNNVVVLREKGPASVTRCGWETSWAGRG